MTYCQSGGQGYEFEKSLKHSKRRSFWAIEAARKYFCITPQLLSNDF